MAGQTTDERLEERLDYRFRDRRLLQTARTHSSFGDGQRSKDREPNPRLAFLGDALLGLVAAEIVFGLSPPLKIGDLTKARKSLVENKRLAQIADHLDLESWLDLGGTERNDKGRGKKKRLATALEAVLGAVYRDAGPYEGTRVVQRVLGNYEKSLSAVTDN